MTSTELLRRIRVGSRSWKLVECFAGTEGGYETFLKFHKKGSQLFNEHVHNWSFNLGDEFLSVVGRLFPYPHEMFEFAGRLRAFAGVRFDPRWLHQVASVASCPPTPLRKKLISGEVREFSFQLPESLPDNREVELFDVQGGLVGKMSWHIVATSLTSPEYFLLIRFSSSFDRNRAVHMEIMKRMQIDDDWREELDQPAL